MQTMNQRFQMMSDALMPVSPGLNTGIIRNPSQLAMNVLINLFGTVVLTVKTQPHDRMPDRPVPAVVDRKPAEQVLLACEKLMQGVDQTDSCRNGAGRERK